MPFAEMSYRYKINEKTFVKITLVIFINYIYYIYIYIYICIYIYIYIYMLAWINRTEYPNMKPNIKYITLLLLLNSLLLLLLLSLLLVLYLMLTFPNFTLHYILRYSQKMSVVVCICVFCIVILIFWLYDFYLFVKEVIFTELYDVL